MIAAGVLFNMNIFEHIDINDIEALKTFEYGLMMACPVSREPNPSDCQFHDIRLLPLEERFNWVDELSDKKCVWHYLRHEKCYSERLARNGLQHPAD
jgi:hypothetical protein